MLNKNCNDYLDKASSLLLTNSWEVYKLRLHQDLYPFDKASSLLSTGKRVAYLPRLKPLGDLIYKRFLLVIMSILKLWLMLPIGWSSMKNIKKLANAAIYLLICLIICLICFGRKIMERWCWEHTEKWLQLKWWMRNQVHVMITHAIPLFFY